MAGLGILIAVLFLALIIAGGIYSYRKNEERKQALAELAKRHGWRFTTDHDGTMEERFPEFSSLRQGSDRYAYNILEGPDGDRQVCAFDYHYETASTDSKGRRTTHNHYFSALVVDTGLPLKPLQIRPEGIFDKLTELFGYDDIDFESDEFSRKFCVTAEDRRWAYDVIHQATMEFLLAAPRFTIQIAGPRIMAYHGGLYEPADFEHALAVVSGIVDRLPAYLQREWQEKH